MSKKLRKNPSTEQSAEPGITAFFRDPAAFLDLVAKVIPTLIQGQQSRIAQQRSEIALFHFSLRQDGYLMLGGSETIGRTVDPFEAVSKKSRIYRRTGPKRPDLMELPIAVRQPIEFVETLDHFQHELKATTDDLQSTIEELASSNEELQSLNEELTTDGGYI